MAASFEEFQSRIQKLYQAGEYQLAFDLSSGSLSLFPDQYLLLNYWRICLAVHLDRQSEALSLLKAVLDNGSWYGEILLRQSPALLPLQGQAEYETLVERNQRLQALDQEALYPLLILRPQQACQDDEHPCPVLLALHAEGSTASACLDFWKPAALHGWLVAAAQSSQAMWKDAYVWDNYDITQDEIQHHLQSLAARYAIDPQRTVIAGYYIGGEVAIWLALSGAVDVSGFIALAPGSPNLAEPDNSWKGMAERAAGRRLRGCLVYGDADPSISIQWVKTLAGMLQLAGVPCRLERLPGVGHSYHPAYAAALLSALNFIEHPK